MNQPWTTPEHLGEQRLPARAVTVPYPDLEAARARQEPRVLQLDGEWALRVVERPAATPADFADPHLDDSDWARVTVPGNWTMQGHGRPRYTNVAMPFRPNDPPWVPEDNPTGCYRRRFDLPTGWLNRRVVLHVGAATSVSTVWVNGVQVGLGKDSRLPSEYDVTEAVHPGTNTLAIQVVQWSDASYIEDQDQWWQAGINRSVWLYATEAVYLADLGVERCDYDPDTGAGKLILATTVGGLPGEERPGGLGGGVERDWRVEAQLEDATGASMLTTSLSGTPTRRAADDAAVATLQAHLPEVAPWSAETPRLYTLLVALVDPDGRTVEATRTRVGFRRVEIRDRQLLVNAKAVTICGVNRHEHHDTFGSAVPQETVELDVRVLKQHNVNAVRTSHYPPDDYFLDLADEYGFYVVDEANIEAHANYDTLCADPAYADAFLDRTARMVLRDRHHPCVISWSLGNESGYGPHHDRAAEWVRRSDPTRPLHYEGAINRDWSGGRYATDVICPMYPSIDAILDWAESTAGTDEQRPLIMCEYAHAMGNSCGNLADYWQAIRSTDGLQGGFIWEMLDHGIARTTPNGLRYWAYGGDFGEEIHDANFVCDGLFWPDRTPHPAMLEAKHVYQPFAAELTSAETVRIENRYDFCDLAHLRIEWQVEVDGRVTDSGVFCPLATAPGASETLAVPWSVPTLAAGQQAYAVLRFSTAEDMPLLGVGHEVGWVQLALGTGPAQRAVTTDLAEHAPPTVHAEADSWRVVGADFEVVLRRENAELTRWRVAGSDRLVAGPTPTVWRAPTDNDGIRLIDLDHASHQVLRKWRDVGLDRTVDEVNRTRLDDSHPHRCRFLRSGRLVPMKAFDGPSVGYDLELTVLPTGALAISVSFCPDAELPDLPRLGLTASTPPGFERMEWLGRGPHESYVDRRSGARIGRWQSTVDEQYVPYVLPQEHGNHTDVRWLALRRDDGVGVVVSADEPVQAKASHYRDATLGTARHTIDLERSETTLLHVDAAQRGLGGASCGPDTLERYRVPSGRSYSLSYQLSPLDPSDDPASVHRG